MLSQGDRIKIKDTSDFELGSDDEVDDVVPDCKIRIYVIKAQGNESKPQVPEKKDKQEPPQIPAPVVSSQPSSSPAVQIQSPTQTSTLATTLVAVDVPIIDAKNWTQPQIS